MAQPPPGHGIDWSLINNLKDFIIAIALGLTAAWARQRQTRRDEKKEQDDALSATRRQTEDAVRRGYQDLAALFQAQLAEARAELEESKRRELDASEKAAELRQVIAGVLEHLRGRHPRLDFPAEDIAALGHVGVEVSQHHIAVLRSLNRATEAVERTHEVAEQLESDGRSDDLRSERPAERGGRGAGSEQPGGPEPGHPA